MNNSKKQLSEKEQLENEKIKLQKYISMSDREIAKLKKMKDDAKLKGDKHKLKVAKRLLKIQKNGRKFFRKEFETREELLNEYKTKVMIVNTMYYAEISNALVVDHNYIVNKKLNRIAERYDRTRRRNKIIKSREYPKVYEFQTPQKNNWILILNKAPSDRSYKGTSSIVVAFLCYYYTSIGIRVFKVIPTGGFSVFNSHFFTRYNERLDLGLADPLEKVKHYFIHNGYSHSKAFHIEGKMYLIGTVKDGFILGELQHDYWAVFMTFISKDMSTEEQDEISKDLNVSLQDKLEDLLNAEDFNRNEYDYKADVKAALQNSKQ